MGCPSQVTFGKDLVFTITTHDPDTGVLTDADAAPIYRVYEDLTATPILTGTMAKLDDPGTTGFYATLIACTTGNGFEAGKNYSIYISATVDADTGGISFGFNVLGNTVPAGAFEKTYTVIKSTDSSPLDGVQVWIATDVGGTNTIWSGVTDALGVARDVNNQKPWLNAGIYFFFRQLAGYSFTNPDSETVP